MNLSGQGFEVYKLLIGAIVALTVLVIIIGTINYFEQLSVNICRKEVSEALARASHVPDGETIASVKECVFESGSSLNSRQLSEAINLKEECFSFEGAQSSSYDVNPNSVHFLRRTETPVFIQCCPTSNLNGCPDMECVIGIGRKPSC